MPILTRAQLYAAYRKLLTRELNRQNTTAKVWAALDIIVTNLFSPSEDTLSVTQVTGLPSLLADKADLVGGVVPASQLPSYVDDIVEVASVAAMQATPGELGKIYIVVGEGADQDKQFRWAGSTYHEMPKGSDYTAGTGIDITNKVVTSTTALDFSANKAIRVKTDRTKVFYTKNGTLAAFNADDAFVASFNDAQPGEYVYITAPVYMPNAGLGDLLCRVKGGTFANLSGYPIYADQRRDGIGVYTSGAGDIIGAGAVVYSMGNSSLAFRGIATGTNYRLIDIDFNVTGAGNGIYIQYGQFFHTGNIYFHGGGYGFNLNADCYWEGKGDISIKGGCTATYMYSTSRLKLRLGLMKLQDGISNLGQLNASSKVEMEQMTVDLTARPVDGGYTINSAQVTLTLVDTTVYGGALVKNANTATLILRGTTTFPAAYGSDYFRALGMNVIDERGGVDDSTVHKGGNETITGAKTFTAGITFGDGSTQTTASAAVSYWDALKRTNADAQTIAQYVDAKVAGLVNSSPATLDTLNELATALGNDPSFATSVNTAIAARAPKFNAEFTGWITGPTPDLAGPLSLDQYVTVDFVRRSFADAPPCITRSATGAVATYTSFEAAFAVGNGGTIWLTRPMKTQYVFTGDVNVNLQGHTLDFQNQDCNAYNGTKFYNNRLLLHCRLFCRPSANAVITVQGGVFNGQVYFYDTTATVVFDACDVVNFGSGVGSTGYSTTPGGTIILRNGSRLLHAPDPSTTVITEASGIPANGYSAGSGIAISPTGTISATGPTAGTVSVAPATGTALEFTKNAEYPFLAAGSFSVNPAGRVVGAWVGITLGVGATLPTLDSNFIVPPSTGPNDTSKERRVLFSVMADSRILVTITPLT